MKKSNKTNLVVMWAGVAMLGLFPLEAQATEVPATTAEVEQVQAAEEQVESDVLVASDSPEAEATLTDEVEGNDLAYEQRSPIVVEVAGMVCGFCASGMERSFARRHDLADMEFSLDDSTVTLHLHEGDSISDETIRDIIVEAGYDVVNIER